VKIRLKTERKGLIGKFSVLNCSMQQKTIEFRIWVSGKDTERIKGPLGSMVKDLYL